MRRPANKKFDPHDLSGIWQLTKNDHTLGTPAPPLTPAGQAAKAGRVPDAGGAIGNAPWYACNPMGFPRLVNDDEPMEFIMLPEPDSAAVPVGAQNPDAVDRRTRIAVRREPRESRPSVVRALGRRSGTATRSW